MQFAWGCLESRPCLAVAVTRRAHADGIKLGRSKVEHSIGEAVPRGGRLALQPAPRSLVREVEGCAVAAVLLLPLADWAGTCGSPGSTRKSGCRKERMDERMRLEKHEMGALTGRVDKGAWYATGWVHYCRGRQRSTARRPWPSLAGCPVLTP